MLLCRQGGWVALDWTVFHAALGHLDVRLEAQLFYTCLRMDSHFWNIFSNVKLVQSTMHVAFNISEKLYFYAMRVLCNVPPEHTKACLKDVVSHWKKSKCSYLTQITCSSAEHRIPICLPAGNQSFSTQSNFIRLSRAASIPSTPSRFRKLRGAVSMILFLSSSRAVKKTHLVRSLIVPV